MSDDEIHEFGINIVLDNIRENGFTISVVQTNRKLNPQIIAKNHEQLFHILVRTACYPNKGKIESKELCFQLLQGAVNNSAFCFVASIGIANANGTTDLEMSTPLRGAGFYVAYDGIEELTFEKIMSNQFTNSLSTFNQGGEIAGSVTRNPDGRHTISVGKKADMSSLLMSLFFVFANDLNGYQRSIFSKWAHLPQDTWTSIHQQTFAQALLHYFMEVRVQGGKLPESVLKASHSFPPQALVDLKYPLTKEIRELFSSLFGGY